MSLHLRWQEMLQILSGTARVQIYIAEDHPGANGKRPPSPFEQSINHSDFPKTRNRLSSEFTVFCRLWGLLRPYASSRKHVHVLSTLHLLRFCARGSNSDTSNVQRFVVPQHGIPFYINLRRNLQQLELHVVDYATPHMQAC